MLKLPSVCLTTLCLHLSGLSRCLSLISLGGVARTHDRVITWIGVRSAAMSRFDDLWRIDGRARRYHGRHTIGTLGESVDTENPRPAGIGLRITVGGVYVSDRRSRTNPWREAAAVGREPECVCGPWLGS
jgi:hypothetical protein